MICSDIKIMLKKCSPYLKSVQNKQHMILLQVQDIIVQCIFKMPVQAKCYI